MADIVEIQVLGRAALAAVAAALAPDTIGAWQRADGTWFAVVNKDREADARSALEPMALAAASLSAAKAAKAVELYAACAAAIIGGFSSAALGAAYAYPSTVTDQINLMGSVTASLLPGLEDQWATPFWCQDGAGEWAFRDHTAAQIQAAGADGKAWVVACQTRLDALAQQVAAATDAQALAAITWE